MRNGSGSDSLQRRLTSTSGSGFPGFPGLNRPNNVPHWQRLHQTHDGVRQWNKVRQDAEAGRREAKGGSDKEEEETNQEPLTELDGLQQCDCET